MMMTRSVSQPDFFEGKPAGSFSEPNLPWPPEAYEVAKEARAANALKLEALIRKLQRKTGRRQRDCALFLLRQIDLDLVSDIPRDLLDSKDSLRPRKGRKGYRFKGRTATVGGIDYGYWNDFEGSADHAR